METSTLQSREISRYAAGLTYQVEPGASDKIAFPSYGPFDQRLGYVALPNIQERLLQRGFTIRQQVRFPMSFSVMRNMDCMCLTRKSASWTYLI